MTGVSVPPASRSTARTTVLPGLAVVVPGVVIAIMLGWAVPVAGALVWAVGLGLLVNNVGRDLSRMRPGFEFATRRLLRIGVVLLGFRLAAGDVLALGPAVLVLITLTVAATFAGTMGLGRALRVPAGITVLTAAGFSICGASAIAATGAVTEAEEDDVAAAIAAITLFGTVGIVAMPAVGAALGLPAPTYGTWVGAGAPEVAHVVAGASTVSGAVAVAIAVKLARVLLLVPMIAVVGARQRRAGDPDTPRPPVVPLFVVGFVAACLIRSTGVVPGPVLGAIELASTILLAAALFALGAGVRIAGLRANGPRPFLLGLLSWLLASMVPLAFLVLT